MKSQTPKPCPAERPSQKDVAVIRATAKLTQQLYAEMKELLAELQDEKKPEGDVK
jgi:hypothetical protein